MKTIQLAVLTGVALIIFSCSCIRNGEKADEKMKAETGIKETVLAEPPLIVYKTKGNYNQLVPVLLSSDKSHIISYPHPTDLLRGGTYTYPTPLDNGFLLDNRGITEDVAFLEYTYEAYTALDSIPNAETLYGLILDKDPLEAFYIMGSRLRYDGNTAVLNQQIKDKGYE
ncbi:MAG: hypothetical protein PHU97_06920 [Bacteroidales bacterium]|nr:hypothetical protein [Bacteroidales bacterium]MDD2323312.1 hypothetical protein [Bacteroidales bacterium]MDD3011032.1 hypothetical protein [Bacteroidales bacterium]MDD3961451.1 hypothetical protein [Bacteroidales bacterium]MDY0285875.1 hypothetical protein [Bacteroidales bacterium]